MPRTGPRMGQKCCVLPAAAPKPRFGCISGGGSNCKPQGASSIRNPPVSRCALGRGTTRQPKNPRKNHTNTFCAYFWSVEVFCITNSPRNSISSHDFQEVWIDACRRTAPIPVRHSDWDVIRGGSHTQNRLVCSRRACHSHRGTKGPPINNAIRSVKGVGGTLGRRNNRC